MLMNALKAGLPLILALTISGCRNTVGFDVEFDTDKPDGQEQTWIINEQQVKTKKPIKRLRYSNADGAIDWSDQKHFELNLIKGAGI